jgi:YidC/Oxa1 family membrane protein insertase
MEKKLIFAIALSMLVLLAWSAIAPKPQPVVVQEVTSSSSTAALEAPAVISQELTCPPKENLVCLDFNFADFEVSFIESLAAIKSVKYKTFQQAEFLLGNGFMIEDKNLVFKKESATKDTVVFSANDGVKKITKKFIFSNSNYRIDLEVSVRNLTNQLLDVSLPLILGTLNYSHTNPQARYQDMTIATKEKTWHSSSRKDQDFADVRFLSLRDRYFCAIVAPAEGNYDGLMRKISKEDMSLGLVAKQEKLEAGKEKTALFRIYLGPQDLKLINQANPNWSAVIYYGTFDFIAQIIWQLVDFLHNVMRNWGLAIIALSLLVYLLLYPLTLKQMRSMKEMQAVQPKVEELRKLYKDNPQKLNKEIMELYRAHKVNPLGGCLPMLLQMPIFFALYQVLIRSVALKGAHFLWIKDLSEPDRLFVIQGLSPSFPVMGNEINILPILMTIGMFVQQKISAVAATSEAAEQQKIMMIVMPVMFGLIFYKMPSGLVLYWFVNSALMLFYQWKISRAK